MTQYLPRPYTQFRETYPEVAEALGALGASIDRAGPLESATARLVKLGIAVGAMAEGAVKSNTRKALEAGSSATEIRQVALAAITTAGFPTAIAALGWIDEVLSAE
jgi:alkylhydroperoxidase/carboxymuconolactone decarboxylase family protein YurZ